jgi:hypothetical protein
MKVQAHLLRSFTAFAEARGEPDHATPHLLTGICDTTERWIDKKAHHDPAGSPDHRFLA